MVGTSSRISMPLVTEPMAEGYCPLSMLCRLGMQTASLQKAFSNSTPPAARASRFGVITCSLPAARMVSHRCWSV